MSPLRGWRIAGQHQFLNGQVNYVAAVIYGINSATLPEKRNFKKRKRGTNIGPSLAIFGVVFGCRPDQGRNACRNSANVFIVSQRSKLAPWARVVSASGLKTHIRSGDVRGGANRSTTLARQRTRTHPRGNTAKARKRKGDRIISTNRQDFRFCYAIFGARSDLRRGDQGSRLGRLSAGLRLSSKLLPRL